MGVLTMSFVEIDAGKLEKFNPFEKIGKDWMLITAGDEKDCNMMTASWGMAGVLWNKNVTAVFVRPQRHTFKFLEENEYYTISFFSEEYRKELLFMGRNSGKDLNKLENTVLKLLYDQKSPYFEQASCVLVCRKIYGQFIAPDCFLDTDIDKNYESKDYHKVFVGEIEKCLIKE